MNRQRWLVAILLVMGPTVAAEAAAAETHTFPGVRYVHRQVSEPRLIDMHLVFIDLNRPGVRVTTTGANGDRAGETDLETTRAFVNRCRAQIGINGGFFSRSAEERRLGVSDLCSLAVADGVVVSPWGGSQKDAINVAADNAVSFLVPAADDPTGRLTSPPTSLHNAIAGNVRLIRDGRILPDKGGDATYPQTAVGHTADHRLILFVSDGRQPGFSEGMTYEEVARVLGEFGAVDAIALDGGGSATLVMVDPSTGETKVLNRPSDGEERAVGNNLAIFIQGE